ncbi:MAG TPA: bifunctional phosphoribosyl-AMP cyclohydrolase/phosphoribosyl-ATP diphosphatase HisIE [Pyrinomonadaceae bacterium]|nr:bifunctional phosphoribosyl-AMP cyclohydrolase/phosphoribosyl-ATP diphosphatase HisIE [Pyrinomonadaceae bacterium]
MDTSTEDLRFDERGLMPAVVQDADTGEVLTLAYMNAESLKRTRETGETWFWSRSRNALWHKGETSGHTQTVVEMRLDCDRDAVLLRVRPRGPACHTGARSCFHNRIDGDDARPAVTMPAARLDQTLDELYALLLSRYRERPADSYTTQLFDEGLEKILAKVDEESQETIAAGRNETDQRLVEETSDLLYHLLVLLVQRGVTLSAIQEELARRRQKRK